MNDGRRYESPAALESAINARIADRYPKDQFQYRRYEVAYRRLLARLYAAEPDKWVVKGGVGLILRLNPSRTSKDIDIAYVDAAGEHAAALHALEQALAIDLGDFFSYEVLRVGEEHEDRARIVFVVSRLGAKEFAQFRVDLALPVTDVPAERVVPPELTGIEAIDVTPPILALAWPQQIADKVCATFERHGETVSSRTRDLADLGMIAFQIDALDGDELINALRAEEQRRRSRTMPDGLPPAFALTGEQERTWRAEFGRATRGAPIEFDDALRQTRALVDPLLDGSAAGKTWRRAELAYG